MFRSLADIGHGFSQAARLANVIYRTAEGRAVVPIHCCLVPCGAGFGVCLCAGAVWVVPPAPSIVILLIFTGFSGRSFASRGMRAIFFTSSTLASSHWPKIVYPPFRLG